MFSPAFLFKFSRSREYHSEERMFSAKSQKDMVNCQFEILKISPQKFEAKWSGVKVSKAGKLQSCLWVDTKASCELSRPLNPCWKSTDTPFKREQLQKLQRFLFMEGARVKKLFIETETWTHFPLGTKLDVMWNSLEDYYSEPLECNVRQAGDDSRRWKDTIQKDSL